MSTHIVFQTEPIVTGTYNADYYDDMGQSIDTPQWQDDSSNTVPISILSTDIGIKDCSCSIPNIFTFEYWKRVFQ